jgi:hypothetical protein
MTLKIEYRTACKILYSGPPIINQSKFKIMAAAPVRISTLSRRILRLNRGPKSIENFVARYAVRCVYHDKDKYRRNSRLVYILEDGTEVRGPRCSHTQLIEALEACETLTYSRLGEDGDGYDPMYSVNRVAAAVADDAPEPVAIAAMAADIAVADNAGAVVPMVDDDEDAPPVMDDASLFAPLWLAKPVAAMGAGTLAGDEDALVVAGDAPEPAEDALAANVAALQQQLHELRAKVHTAVAAPTAELTADELDISPERVNAAYVTVAAQLARVPAPMAAGASAALEDDDDDTDSSGVDASDD